MKEHPDPPAPLAIAELAARLLPDGNKHTLDQRNLEDAVALADRLLVEASKPRVRHAYEEFGQNDLFNMEEIGARFAELQWADLTTGNAVTKLVHELLQELHKGIQLRRILISYIFNRRSVYADPNDLAESACHKIKAMLLELKMDYHFGTQIDEAAQRIWDETLVSWLNADQHMEQDYKRVFDLTPAFFDEVVLDLTYSQYLASKRYPTDLNSDRLLSVIVWLQSEFSAELGREGSKNSLLDTLYWLNDWPETAYPGDRRISQPLSECIRLLEGDDDQKSDLQIQLTQGIGTFSRMLAMMKLKEFASICSPETVINSLSHFLLQWNSIEPEFRADALEIISCSPETLVHSLIELLKGRSPGFSLLLPCDGLGVVSLTLQPYFAELEALARCLWQAQQLLRTCNLDPEPLETCKAQVEVEKRKTIELDQLLRNSEIAALRMEAGRKIIEKRSKPSRPGRISPYLLFRYAAERGLRRDLLTTR